MKVSSLQIAPVKALAVVPRHEVMIGPYGVPEDRRLFLVADDDSIATLRRFPQLATVIPTLDLQASTIAARLPDGREVIQPLPDDGPELRTRLFGRERKGVVGCGPVSEAISVLAGVRLRLVMTDGCGQGWDEGPISLLATASDRAVREAADDEPARFRMTVGVDGVAAFEEDAWTDGHITIGKVVLRDARPLGRCIVIEHSPASGERDWPGLKRLAGIHPPRGITLGIVASVLRPGVIRVGDRVEVEPVR